MPVSNEDADELADKAVQELCAAREKGERSTIAAKAREFGIYRDYISQRLKGREGRIGRKPTNRKLSAIQEATLVRYILSLDEISHFIRHDKISNIANTILL